MRRKIFGVMTATMLGLVIVLGILMTLVYHSFYRSAAERELESLAGTIIYMGHDRTNVDLNEAIIKNFPYQIRLTLIDNSGNVLFDSRGDDTQQFDNHAERAEIREAFKKGFGRDSRHSDTFGKETYYYAVKLSENEVLRFSREIDGISSMFLSILPVLLAVALVVVIIGLIVAYRITGSIVRPISKLAEQLNIRDVVEKGNVPALPAWEYEELRPIALTIGELSRQNALQISRLKEEKEAIAVITAGMLEGMVLLDRSENILSINSSAYRILNPDFSINSLTTSTTLVAANAKSHNILQLTHSPVIVKALERAKLEGKAVAFIEGEDGKSYQLFVNRVTDGKLSGGTLILLVDNTSTRKAEEIRRGFAANVSHELRTPLTTIQGFGELLSQSSPTAAEAAQWGGTIYREAGRLLTLINDILRLSEIEECAHAQEPVLIDLCISVEDALKELTIDAEKKSVNISAELPKTPLMAKCEPQHFHEVIRNLCENAIRYNHVNGWVKVSLSFNDGKVILVVADGGIGIPKEQQERIFERFYRVDKSRSKQTGGTGLGLSIVKHIVTLYDGEIVLNSDIGSGTVVTVKLPLEI